MIRIYLLRWYRYFPERGKHEHAWRKAGKILKHVISATSFCFYFLYPDVSINSFMISSSPSFPFQLASNFSALTPMLSLWVIYPMRRSSLSPVFILNTPFILSAPVKGPPVLMFLFLQASCQWQCVLQVNLNQGPSPRLHKSRLMYDSLLTTYELK